MDTHRRPFQGVANIVWFNWPYFALALASWVVLGYAAYRVDPPMRTIFLTVLAFGAGLTLISLLVSLYVYDLSGFYRLQWLNRAKIAPGSRLLNINAGFDETSHLLAARFSPASMEVWDFFQKERHTEPSIARARGLYRPFPGTITISTLRLPPTDPFDCILLIFAAHEIRDDRERIVFFSGLKALLRPGGCIIVTEHLRDGANTLAYHFGVRHFLPGALWLRTFRGAGLQVAARYRVNPFVTTFLLTHGVSA
jgi:SAM-dependent methyltransferase